MNKTLTVLSTKRLANSTMGNPRYKLHTLQGDYTTAANSGHVYSFEYYKLERGDVINVELNNSGKITSATIIEETK